MVMTINEQNQSLQCPVCKDPMAFQIAKGRKSGKPFLMVKCLRDGRHFRGFVGDQVYVRKLLEHLERGNGSETVMKSEENALVSEK
jgi:predicted RNA-binding Zn-ribbon protein involved in translation (DUF1610 family)